MPVKPQDMTAKQLEEYIKTTWKLPYGPFHWSNKDIKLVATDLLKLFLEAKERNTPIKVTESLMGKLFIYAKESRGMESPKYKKPKGAQTHEERQRIYMSLLKKKGLRGLLDTDTNINYKDYKPTDVENDE
tara:strand:+ start:587 stop:979 length:393 start_codon:yes stop_codon:yes gene_type:complete